MSEYEFSKDDNTIFESLANWMVITAVLVFLSGVSLLADYFIGSGHIYALLRGIIICILAITFYLPANNFRKIAKTEGNDITELMTAFNELSKGWLVVNILFAIYLITTFTDFFQILTR